MEMLYEGKAKKVYSTDTKNVLRIEYKNSATAFNGVKKDIIEGKGILNNLFSSFFFTMLAEKNIQSHFIKKISDTEQLVTAVTIIPLEVIVRNVAAGTLAKRIGKEEGFIMKKPIIELCYKNDELGDPILNDDHIEILELATPIELKVIKIKALQINDVLKEYFENHHIDLIDFKLEFGKTADGIILLADEISPDTCRLWDSTTKQKFDKDVFRRDIAPLRETYQALADKLGIS
ncbi:MAG: phosphoribosylaminoimidazolesuccinocarboxamide synthase [Bacteroidetes bacterium]|jgi:phosphoribosylaminoimidazole-succinocarboxamide synthase|nr:phosphoribosylaminoimidazolesuccinocarboxamide synthase [Bacteroidota bacterium]